jgi:hypothetical protein
MRSIKTSTGVSVALDGDLLAMLELLYREVTARHDLERSFDDMNKEIANPAAAYIHRVGGRPRPRTVPTSRKKRGRGPD